MIIYVSGIVSEHFSIFTRKALIIKINKTFNLQSHYQFTNSY